MFVDAGFWVLSFPSRCWLGFSCAARSTESVFPHCRCHLSDLGLLFLNCGLRDGEVVLPAQLLLLFMAPSMDGRREPVSSHPCLFVFRKSECFSWAVFSLFCNASSSSFSSLSAFCLSRLMISYYLQVLLHVTQWGGREKKCRTLVEVPDFNKISV